MQDNNQNLPNQTPTVVNPAPTDDQSGGFPSLPEQPDSVPFETNPAPVSETPPVANGSDTPSKPSSPPRGNVLKLVATMFGLLLLAGGVIAGVTLTQQQQLINQKAGACPGASNCSTTCPDGTQFSDQCPASGAFASCSQWANEACASHQGSGGGTTGGTTSCNTSGAPCSTTCANGRTFSDPCPGGGSFSSCTQWATQACATVGSTPTGGGGTTTTTGECNPGDGTLPFNGDVRCGTCSSPTQGELCGLNGKWSGQCVQSHACGYVANVECGNTDNNASTPDVTCQSRGYSSDFTCQDFKCVSSNRGTFLGCGTGGVFTGSGCQNCYSNGQCYDENVSCGTNINCRTTTPTTPPTTGGGGGGGTTTTTQAICGSACNSTADCAAAGNGGTVTCTNGICQNTACIGKTIPGRNCDCSALNACGQPCSASLGLCQAGSICRYIVGNTCTLTTATTPTTYCVPTTLPTGWVTQNCVARDQGNSFVLNESGQNPTVAEVQQACAPTSASCSGAQAYDTSWNPLTAAQLSALKPGDKVRFTVTGTTTSGAFDKARFTINGTLRPEVTTKRPSSADFYDEYTIPTGVTSFTVKAEIHHTALNQWY